MIVLPPELADEFFVQAPTYPLASDRHDYVVCKKCSRTWYLPRIEQRRARSWQMTLCIHVEEEH
jgi:hypothetical protein